MNEKENARNWSTHFLVAKISLEERCEHQNKIAPHTNSESTFQIFWVLFFLQFNHFVLFYVYDSKLDQTVWILFVVLDLKTSVELQKHQYRHRHRSLAGMLTTLYVCGIRCKWPKSTTMHQILHKKKVVVQIVGERRPTSRKSQVFQDTLTRTMI